MKDRMVTRKQFAAAIFTGLLSPLMRVLPRSSVLLAGKAAWLSVAPAFLALLALMALMNALRRALLPGEGMANLLLRVLGPWFGRLALLLYAAWFLFYAGFLLRSGAERLTATVYQQSAVTPFIVVMLALCLLAALGTLRATVRTAVLLRAILLMALGVVSVFSLSNLEPGNLFPLTLSDGPGIVLGALPILTVGGVAALFSFLNAYVEPAAQPVRWTVPPLALFALVALLLCFEAVGTFGAALTARLSYPFFTMIRDVSIFHIAQRIEAVVIALWVYADFILCALLLRCAGEALRTLLGLPKPEGLPLFSLRRGRWLFWLEGALAYAAARLIAPSAAELVIWTETRVPFLMNCFVFGGFSLVWLVGRMRKKL